MGRGKKETVKADTKCNARYMLCPHDKRIICDHSEDCYKLHSLLLISGELTERDVEWHEIKKLNAKISNR